MNAVQETVALRKVETLAVDLSTCIIFREMLMVDWKLVFYPRPVVLVSSVTTFKSLHRQTRLFTKSVLITCLCSLRLMTHQIMG